MVEQPRVETEFVPGRTDACLEVGCAEREPSFQRVRVPVVGTGVTGGECVRGRAECILRRRHAAATAEEGAHGLGGRPFRFLGQQPDVCRPRADLHRAAIGRDSARERAEQRRLADPVGTDQTDPVTGREGEIDGIEDDEWASNDGELTSDERRGHDGTSRNERTVDGSLIGHRPPPYPTPNLPPSRNFADSGR